MVLCPLGGTVSVLVGGKALTEYEVKGTIEGNVKTYTCCEWGEESDTITSCGLAD